VVGLYERKKNTQLSWQSYVFIAVAFALYSFFAAWQDEHRNTAGVITDKLILSSQFNSCSTNLKEAQTTLHAKGTLADSFQAAFVALQAPQAQLQANISTCINTLAKMNPKVRESIAVISIPLYKQDPNSNRLVGIFAPHAMYAHELVIATNEVEPRFHGYLRCENPFDAVGTPELPTSSQSVFKATASPARISEREYEISATASGTEWSPTSPAYMRITTHDENPGKCTFTPIG
jgi:hypothetical protein